VNLKKIGKSFLCTLLEGQAKRLLARQKVIIIAVGGSIGKTSTKLAIARTLEKTAKVIYQDGNYNDRLTVPLVLFKQAEPNIFNLFAWVKILLANEKVIKNPYPYDVAVLEIGTDGPGQLKDFSYLNPDLYVLTAINEEHMVYFKTIDKVADEELVPVSFSKQSLINLNNVDPKYLPDVNYLSYGTKGVDFSIIKDKFEDVRGQELTIKLKDETKPLVINTKMLGEQGSMIVLAAVSVNHILGKPASKIKDSIENLEPVPGRMQVLEGIEGATIIDDTYNASPVAVEAALSALYGLSAKSKIAILGSMNELGAGSAEAHRLIGKYCKPKQLDLVVTIGSESKRYLAPAAKTEGCQVVSFLNPHEAGDYVKSLIKPGAIILAKGSQNGVFAEEAIKPILNNSSDTSKLVRQSKYWMSVKSKQFS
jgi:UDP-N-acetylmuramoyl-tripeptide--D-alanyl-D-alanine ligase